MQDQKYKYKLFKIYSKIFFTKWEASVGEHFSTVFERKKTPYKPLYPRFAFHKKMLKPRSLQAPFLFKKHFFKKKFDDLSNKDPLNFSQ